MLSIEQKINDLKNTNLVIGAGIFGLNIAINLIEKGEKVLLITDTFESVSYHYPIGAHTSRLKTDNLSLYSFNTKIINPLWIFNLLLNYNYSTYNKHKEYCAEYGFNLYKNKYNVEIYKRLNNDFILDSKFIINFLLTLLKKSELFSYDIRHIDVKNKKTMKNLSNEFKNIYVCIGSKCKSHMFLQKIGGYKFYINSKNNPESIDVDNGYFINNNNIFENQNYAFKSVNIKIPNHIPEEESNLNDTLIVRGGILLGDKNYHDVIYIKQSEYDLNKSYRDYLNSNLVKDICKKYKKRIYKINQNKFWKKYECYDIQKIMKGVRGVSVDNLPFYYRKKNIYYIEGGSFIGIITAPVLADSLINDKKTKINFNISRIYVNTFIKIVSILFVLFLIQIKIFQI